jgi:ABC-type nitrate/sulfonate/bicarbonate transport system permease component
MTLEQRAVQNAALDHPVGALGRSTSTARRALAFLWPFLLLLGIWQAWVSLGDVSPLVAPTPADVVRDLAAAPDVYLENTGWTLFYSVAGLAIGMSVGVLLAVFAWVSPFLGGVVTPSMLLIRSVPIVAVVPILAGVLGYSPGSVLAATSLISLFTTYVFASSGMRATPAGSDDLLSVLGASRKRRLLRLAVPSAVPNILIALRLNAAMAIVAAIIGEYLMGQDGLGWLFAQSFARTDIPRAWGASLLIIVLSVVAYMVTSWLEEEGRERWSV